MYDVPDTVLGTLLTPSADAFNPCSYSVKSYCTEEQTDAHRGRVASWVCHSTSQLLEELREPDPEAVLPTTEVVQNTESGLIK